ncbi:peroxisomal biogenesis factor 11 [Globomyces pollinis-pini]|nr:peroxisomal biogenesis factor 11 [Globomyces pollinis-pini]
MVELERLCRFFDSVRGTDKALMFFQYSSKLMTWHLRNMNPSSPLACRIANLAGPVSDFRVLLRYYGLLPLTKYAIDCENKKYPNARLKTLERLQNFMMFLYYPLEHTYWLALHQVIPMTEATRNKIGTWSCRFWAAYVIFYFGQLWEERNLRKLKYKAVLAKKSDSDPDTLKEELRKLDEERKGWLLSAFVNSCYFPLTVHWSLETSSFPDVGVGFFGTLAALAQIYGTWKAT